MSMNHTNYVLYDLDLSCNLFEDEGADEIIKMLGYNNTLHTLEISENEISDEKLKTIAQMMLRRRIFALSSLKRGS